MEDLYFGIGGVIAIVMWVATVVSWAKHEKFSIEGMVVTVAWAVLMAFASIFVGLIWPFGVVVCVLYLGVQYAKRRP